MSQSHREDVHDELVAGYELLKVNLLSLESRLHRTTVTQRRTLEETSKTLFKLADQCQHYINLAKGKDGAA